MKNVIAGWFKELQNNISIQIKNVDSKSIFKEDTWDRQGGGGGKTKILSGGNVIERGGVNFSEVYGPATEFLKSQFNQDAKSFYATGISIVIHPVNPHVPIIHMNTRYLEIGDKSWFGGGIDLTPHYINPDDSKYFHLSLKNMCDQFNLQYYPLFKKQADDYFFLHHRNETRGIGGIFYDHLEENKLNSKTSIFNFIKATGTLFAPLYINLIDRNKNKSFSENEKRWQSLRRGRYVEFNLIYDKGTRFGLETNGRTESILMSLPPNAEWEYDFKPEPESNEATTLSFLKKDVDWVNL